MNETHIIVGVTGAELDSAPRQMSHEPIYVWVHCYTEAAGMLEVRIALTAIQSMLEALEPWASDPGVKP